jgi:hypothetical protein
MKRVLLILVSMMLFVALAACGDDDDSSSEDAAGGDCSEAPAEATVDEMADFPTPEGTTYTGGDQAGPSFIAEGYFDGDLPDAFDAYHETFEDAGYDVTKDEQEEIDAEVFFAGDGTTGQVNMFAECDDRTKLRITVRPD